MKLLSPNLQAFYFTATLGTVHAAAKHLHLTQTAATRRIAALEQEVKMTLFLRSRKGMSLTERGRQMLKYCRQALELEGEVLANSFSSDKEPTQKITVEGPSSFINTRVLECTSQVLKKHPQLILHFRINDEGSGVDSLKLGQADLVIIPSAEVVKEFDSKKLKPEQYILVAPAAWSTRKLEDIIEEERIIDFNATDKMTLNYLEYYGLHHNRRRDRHFINNTDALAKAVELGAGYSVLSKEFAEPWIQQKKLISLCPKKHFDYSLALAWYPRKYLPDYLRAVISSLK